MDFKDELINRYIDLLVFEHFEKNPDWRFIYPCLEWFKISKYIFHRESRLFLDHTHAQNNHIGLSLLDCFCSLHLQNIVLC